MRRKYYIGIDGSGVDELIHGLQEYKRWLRERSRVLLQRLADEGFQVARAGFQNAIYDGTNDVSVSIEDRGEHTKAIVAVGKSVLFIEFGTGITYASIAHPEAEKHGMIRGGYGKGQGNQKYWGYYGEPGTNGWPQKYREPLVITRGNPANAPVYNAAKYLRQRLTELAREVFS